MEGFCVDPKRVHEFWPFARDLIRSAIEYTGLSSPDDIEAAVLYGGQLLWLACENDKVMAAATTQLVKPLDEKVCILTAFASEDMNRWLPLFKHIEQYAKDEGCAIMRIYGRRGWQRVLDGYQVRHVILEKDLDDGRN